MFCNGTSTAIDLVANMIYDGTMPGEKLMADAGVSKSEVLGAMAINEMAKMEGTIDTSITDGSYFVDGPDKRTRTDSIGVVFQYKSKFDEAEFARQLADQQRGMNDLTVQEYLDNRKKYLEHGRATESALIQHVVREKAFIDKVDELQDAGLSLREAEEQARRWIDTQAALHNPDQIAGGHAHSVDGVGDRNINSSIGRQWRYRIDAVDEQLQRITEGMSETEKLTTYLNIYLTYEGDKNE